MNKQEFEEKVVALTSKFPEGFDDTHWHIKYDLIDGEYFIRWTNGVMDRGHRELKCHYKDGEFIYY